VVECIPNKPEALSSNSSTIKQNTTNHFAVWCSGVYLCTPVLSALVRLRQEDPEFKASLGYISRPCLKKKKNKINKALCAFKKIWY
jgi:hypothetical protein